MDEGETKMVMIVRFAPPTHPRSRTAIAVVPTCAANARPVKSAHALDTACRCVHQPPKNSPRATPPPHDCASPTHARGTDQLRAHHALAVCRHALPPIPSRHARAYGGSRNPPAAIITSSLQHVAITGRGGHGPQSASQTVASVPFQLPVHAPPHAEEEDLA